MEVQENLTEGNVTSGKHATPWTENQIQPQVQADLKQNLETDVVIVGGGLAGLSTAYCLTQAGKKVVVVEDGQIGSGETGRTTAHLVTALDDRWYTLEQYFGEKNTKLIADSHKAAINFVEETVKKENIDCDFERVNGFLFLHPSDTIDSLKKEVEAARRAGLDVNVLDNPPEILEAGDSIRFAHQAQFHPMKYLSGLCKAIQENGGQIYTHTHAEKIEPDGVTTSTGFVIRAKHIVVATNSPVNNRYAMHLKQYAYRTYVLGALVKKDTMQHALWWDTGDFDMNKDIPPYHYVRLTKYDSEHDLLICGGEDHPIGDTHGTDVPEEGRYAILEKWMRQHFNVGEIVYEWSGQVLEPMDGLAFIGRNPYDNDNVYIITGDSGNGMTHCTIGGMLITDMIMGKQNPWEELYKPTRFTLKASKPFFKEVIGSLLAMLKNKPEHKDQIELSSIKKDEGKVVELGGEKCGVYRDKEDLLHIVSTACTHLQCTVKWNNDEKSWDCPCHGSRFTYDGKVLNGPANKDLPCYTENNILKDK